MARSYRVAAFVDSILDDIELPHWVRGKLYSQHGATVQSMLDKLRHDFHPARDTDLAFVHVGTNDVDNGRAICNIVNDYEELLYELQSRLPNVDIVVCGVLGRPRDDYYTFGPIKELNFKLNKMCDGLPNLHFLELYDSFLYRNEYIMEYFRFDGLHLSRQGRNVATQVVKYTCHRWYCGGLSFTYWSVRSLSSEFMVHLSLLAELIFIYVFSKS